MEKTLAIKHIHPSLIPWVDYIVEDVEQNIKWYHSTIIEPTQTELEAAWLEVQAKQALEESKAAKSAQIQQIASLTDQLNLLWAVVYKLTEWSTDPEILAARTKYEQIQAILNS